MRTINISILVDAESALSSGSLKSNVYLVDTNKNIGSWQQGTSELNTVCQDGQAISWWATPINPGNTVMISGFAGAMVSSKTCVPQPNTMAGSNAWGGQAQTRGSVGSFPYTLTLDLGGKTMSFSATLKVV